MMNTKAFDDDCSYMERVWEQRRISEVRLQAALGEVVGGVQMYICGAKLPKDVAKHLNTKLHKDNCKRKGVQDVPDEVVLEEPVLAAGQGGVVPQSLPAASRHIPRSSDAHLSRLQFEKDELFEQEELHEDCSSAA